MQTLLLNLFVLYTRLVSIGFSLGGIFLTYCCYRAFTSPNWTSCARPQDYSMAVGITAFVVVVAAAASWFGWKKMRFVYGVEQPARA